MAYREIRERHCGEGIRGADMVKKEKRWFSEGRQRGLRRCWRWRGVMERRQGRGKKKNDKETERKSERKMARLRHMYTSVSSTDTLLRKDFL